MSRRSRKPSASWASKNLSEARAHVRGRNPARVGPETARTQRRRLVVAGFGSGHGDVQQGSAYVGAAACVEMAGALRCDPDGGEYARSRRQSGAARAPADQSGLQRPAESASANDDAHYANDFAVA